MASGGAEIGGGSGGTKTSPGSGGVREGSLGGLDDGESSPRLP